MTTESRVHNSWIRYLPFVSILITFLILVLGGGTFLYNNVWRIADIRYKILPAYEVTSFSVGGLTIDNSGRKSAEGVWIKADLESTLTEDITIKSDEPYEIRQGGSSGEDNFHIWLDRLTPSASVTIYIVSLQPSFSEQGLYMTWKDGKARPWSSRAPYSWVWSIFVGLGASLGGVCFGLLVALATDRLTKRIASGRKKETPG